MAFIKIIKRTHFFGEYCKLIIILGKCYIAKSYERFRIIIDITN